MTRGRTFKVKRSLSYKIKEPGGRLVRDAEALDTHRDDVMANVATILDQLDAVCADKPDDGGARIYALASSMIDVAGFFDTGPLYDAAYSLCDIADRMIAGDKWRWPAVQVHLQALRLILAGGCKTGRTSDLLLEGLRSVAANIR